MLATASVGFTACDDDDDFDAINVVSPVNGELTFTSDVIEVKIGAQNKAALPVATSGGELKAFSINPEIAEIVYVDGVPMIEGIKNGIAEVMVSDSNNNYKSLKVDVYTTNDKLEFNSTNLTAELPYGLRATCGEARVTVGNGGYTIECDNESVIAAIDSESGQITLTTTAGDVPVVCNLLVTDCRNLTGTMTVTLKGGFFAFTEYDYIEIAAINNNVGEMNGMVPTQFDEYTAFYETIENGYITFGGKKTGWGLTWGVAQIVYPEGTPLNEEVDGSFIFGDWSETTYPGKVKILVDNDVKRVGVWYNVDASAKKISRGYVVWKK